VKLELLVQVCIYIKESKDKKSSDTGYANVGRRDKSKGKSIGNNFGNSEGTNFLENKEQKSRCLSRNLNSGDCVYAIPP
jgi:hypothetical protein